MGNKDSKHGGGASSSANAIVSSLKSGPSSSKVHQHLENAKKSRILQLKNCNIKEIPSSVDEVANILRNLDLSENKIVSLPPKISSFQSLKQLHLQRNRFTLLPDEIGCLKTLELLDVSFNKLSTLPSSLAGCSALKTLNASNNVLTDFPVGVCHALQVDNVDLSNNLIETLPDDISHLNAIELNLNKNRLNKLNDNLADCKNLRVFRVEENCLDKCEFTPKILGESTISLITYSGNLFQDKDFQALPQHEKYEARFSASKRKI
ncbi:Leucine-rich repeat-containing protein 57 [Aphelenchoides bicaudatus]|nr:Leucine-rich repeat-containing protein 57 [Aphelenchoides bicaudatus]